MFFDHLHALITSHGYVIVGLIVGLESMGLPLPGETTLITAAIFAGTTHQLNIWLVIAAAAAGAIAGDNAGYWLGRRFGHALLVRYGPLLRIDSGRIKLGQFLFAHHGGKVVFFGRFVAVLRALAAVLAGLNYMPWEWFLFFNAAGGVVWALVFGLGAYQLGEAFERLSGALAIASVVLAAIAVAVSIWFIRRHEASLVAEAERAFPGPVDARRAGRR